MLEAEISLEGDASWVQTSFNFTFLFVCLLLQGLNFFFIFQLMNIHRTISRPAQILTSR